MTTNIIIYHRVLAIKDLDQYIKICVTIQVCLLSQLSEYLVLYITNNMQVVHFSLTRNPTTYEFLYFWTTEKKFREVFWKHINHSVARHPYSNELSRQGRFIQYPR